MKIQKKNNNLRQNELDCLNKIKDSFIYFKGLKKVFDNSNYLTVVSMLNSAHQNENHSAFPDFFFDGGIIEHFEVSSSNETRKGSQYKIDDAYCQRENEKYFKQCDDNFKNSPYYPGTIRIETVDDVHDCFTYGSFVNSFKRNVEHHIESLKKSAYVTQLVVFLIEQQSGILGIYEHDIFNRFYRIYEDKTMLQYMKETMAGVNYVIFYTTDSYEIIDLSKIDSMIERAKENLDIRGNTQNNATIMLYMDW